MAVAIAALVIAIAGTAVASVGTISVLTKNDKKQIRKIAGKVADQRVRSLASGLTVASATSAGAAGTAERAKSADFATKAGNVPDQLWAIVHADGTLYRGSPGIVGSSAEGEGKNTVVTDRDLHECFFVATLGGDTSDQGLNGDVSVAPINGEPNAVYVRTGENGSNAAKPFTLQISC
jgi:hypothetical protein